MALPKQEILIFFNSPPPPPKKFQTPSASTFLLWNRKTFLTFQGFARVNCAVCERQGALMQELMEKKNAKYFRNQNQGLLNDFSTAPWRLVFPKYLRPSWWCTGLLSDCHPICSSYSTIWGNHISKPNISWITSELHIFLCKYSLKSYYSQSNFYLSSFKETSRRVIVSHNTGTQFIHHPSCFNQAL